MLYTRVAIGLLVAALIQLTGIGSMIVSVYAGLTAKLTALTGRAL